jgi:tRNA (guanine26-N2/guanine27-N2)-dimethyltransferase
MVFFTEHGVRIKQEAGVFYNPKMEELRDISVIIAEALGISKPLLLDSTCATGIRGIRYEKEAGAIVDMLDINAKAASAASKNVAVNKASAKVINKSIQEFANTTKNKYDIIDLDPFGTPAPYIYDLMKIASKGAMFMVTATDGAVLCGAHQKACVKLYNSVPLHNELCHEAGIRILLSFISRMASQFNMGIFPVLSIYKIHYMRVFLYLRSGAQEAFSSMSANGYVSYCTKCHAYYTTAGIVATLDKLCPNCEGRLLHSGPMWVGEMDDKTIVKEAFKMCDSEEYQGASLILHKKLQELSVPFFYSIPRITRSAGISSVSPSLVIEELGRMGISATKAMFEKDCIKSACGIREVTAAIKSVAAVNDRTAGK